MDEELRKLLDDFNARERWLRTHTAGNPLWLALVGGSIVVALVGALIAVTVAL